MQGPNEYNFIYNDGEYQIQEEEIHGDGEEAGKKYYAVDKNYKHIASFKDKKESLLYIGWRNTRALKDNLKSSLSTVGDLNEPKGILKDVNGVNLDV